MNTVFYSGAEELSEIKKKLLGTAQHAVCAIGFFDGVHVAHSALIKAARENADRLGVPLVAITFLGEDGKLKPNAARLIGDKERCELISECGAHSVLLCDFSAVSYLSPDTFVRNFLVDSLGIVMAVVGADFRFGRGGAGTAEDLVRCFRECSHSARVIDEILIGGLPVSSTRIRGLLSKGDPRAAAELLGYPYFITGEVAHGKGIGTGMGIPTINTEIPEGRFIPAIGVYASVSLIGGTPYPSLTNIGSCPTFGERGVHAETYVLGTLGSLYGEHVKIYLIDYLREERKFASAGELVSQIEKDKERALKLYGEIKWQEIGLR